MSSDDRLVRFGKKESENQYDNLKAQRETKRADYIKQGKLIHSTHDLDDAIAFKGECLDMCPEFERCERELQFGLDPFEKMDGGDKVDHAKAIKRFRRSAAGDEEPLPCDVRPPHILVATLDYLFTDILAKHGLEKSYSFVRDRARAIRKDFFLQNYRGLEAIQCHERIARYHIMCMHELCESQTVSLQQEHEQMRKTLQSLREYYADFELESRFSENEAEFQAYYILSHIFQSEFVTRAESMRSEIYNHPMVQLAIMFHHLCQRNNESSRSHPITEGSINAYTRFFRNLASSKVPYLFSCLLHMSFVSVRKGALKAMQKSFYCFPGQENSLFRLDDLVTMLGFDDVEEVKLNLEYYEIPLQSDSIVLIGKMKTHGKVTSGQFKEDQRASYAPKRSKRLLDVKRVGILDIDLVNGLIHSQAKTHQPFQTEYNSTPLKTQQDSNLVLKQNDNLRNLTRQANARNGHTISNAPHILSHRINTNTIESQPVIPHFIPLLSNQINTLHSTPLISISQPVNFRTRSNTFEFNAQTTYKPFQSISSNNSFNGYKQTVELVKSIASPVTQLPIIHPLTSFHPPNITLSDTECLSMFSDMISTMIKKIALQVHYEFKSNKEQAQKAYLEQQIALETFKQIKTKVIQKISMELAQHVYRHHLEVLSLQQLELRDLRCCYESVGDEMCFVGLRNGILHQVKNAKAIYMHEILVQRRFFKKWLKLYLFRRECMEKRRMNRNLMVDLGNQIGVLKGVNFVDQLHLEDDTAVISDSDSNGRSSIASVSGSVRSIGVPVVDIVRKRVTRGSSLEGKTKQLKLDLDFSESMDLMACISKAMQVSKESALVFKDK